MQGFFPQGQNIVRIIGREGRGGGGQVCICVQNMWQTRTVWGHAPLESFDFGPFTRRNLVESEFTVYCLYN